MAATGFGQRVEVTKEQQPLKSLMGSARRLTSSSVKRLGLNDDADGGWKQDAIDLYHLIGEHQFIVNSLAGRTGAARLYLGKLDRDDPTATPELVDVTIPDDPEAEPVDPTDKQAYDVFAAFGDTPAGRAQLVARQSVNLSVPGDGYLVGIPAHMLTDEYREKPSPFGGLSPEVQTDNLPIDDVEWRVLSNQELKRDKGNDEIVEVEIDGEDFKFHKDSVWVIRVWDPDPFRWVQSTSPTRSNLPVLRELFGLTQHVSAQIDSRLAGAGMFLVPQEVRDAVINAMGGIPEDADEDWDPFTESMMAAAQAAIEDRSSASAMVPLVMTVPGDRIEQFRYISFATELDKEARQLREEAIRRLALGMNAPPEVLLGVGSMNHWGAWLVAEDTIKTYVEPQLALICDALTTQYLWAVLEQLDIENFKDYVIWYDVDHLIARPTKLADAALLHEAGVLSDSALRDAGQFTDDDAPTEVTDNESAGIVLKMVTANPSLIRNPGVDALLESINRLLQGEGSPATEPQAAIEEEPIEGELMPLETETEGGPPLTASTAPTPINVHVNVEPQDATYEIILPEGFTAASPPPEVNVYNSVEPTPVTVNNHVEPTPVEVVNEIPEMNVTVEPTPVTVNTPEVNVNVEPTPVTVETPKVEVAAPQITVKPAPVKVVRDRSEKRKIKLLRDREGRLSGAEETDT